MFLHTLVEGYKKPFKSGGPQRLNRIDLYGKKLIPMEKNYKKWGSHAPVAPQLVRLCLGVHVQLTCHKESLLILCREGLT